MSRSRVLLVAPHFPPETVAGAARLAAFARDLRALGHRVRVVAPGAAEAADDDVARAGRVPKGSGPAAQALWQLRLGRALARAAGDGAGCDVALISTPPPLAALLVARRLAGRVPVVLDVRDIWPDVMVEAGATGEWSAARAALAVIERGLLARSRAIVTVTDAKVARLRGRFAGPVTLVPNGVDSAWLSGAPPHEGGPGEGFRVACAGNVGLAQDVGLVVEAVACARPVAGLSCEVVGDGEDEARVRALAARLAAPVTFAGRVPRETARARLAASSCAVVTLRSRALADSVPTRLLEAMALGVPVVLVAAGEAAELVAASGGGLVTPPGDRVALTRALESLASMSRDERLAMGRRGREHVVTCHRREDAARVLSAVLDAVAAGR